MGPRGGPTIKGAPQRFWGAKDPLPKKAFLKKEGAPRRGPPKKGAPPGEEDSLLKGGGSPQKGGLRPGCFPREETHHRMMSLSSGE